MDSMACMGSVSKFLGCSVTVFLKGTKLVAEARSPEK